VKNLILTSLLAMLALPAHATIKTLNCAAPNKIGGVQATLDDSSLQPPYARVSKASIRYGFANAQLTCSGWGQLNVSTNQATGGGHLSCIGYWFNSAEQITEVTIVNKGGQLEASFHALKGHMGMLEKGGPWTCTIGPAQNSGQATDDSANGQQ